MAPPPKKKLDRVRNIGVIAHIDAGKTTVSERFLYYSGRIHKIGEVHTGDTQMDYTEQERKHGITITAATTSFLWEPGAWHEAQEGQAGGKDKKAERFEIHLIDTPGHVDFTIEVERSLRVLDGAVVVFSAVDGVEPQSETVWHQADKFQVPRVCFVNKMDRIGADFEGVLKDITERLSAKPAPIQLPLGAEDKFQGAIDLVEMRRVTYTGEEEDAPTVEDIEPGERAEAEAARERLVEIVADVDDALAELYLAGTAPDAETLRAALRRATLSNKIVPVLCGAALRNRGVQQLLDAVVEYLPAPSEVPPVKGENPRTGELEERPADDKAPLCALAFKIIMVEGRKAVYLRIYSGTLSAGDEVYNPRLLPAGKEKGPRRGPDRGADAPVVRGRTEKVARLFSVHADSRDKLEQAKAGMIVLATGLRDTATGDTLCSPTHPIQLERIDTYEPVISQAAEAGTTAEAEKMQGALQKMVDEDPTFRVREDAETGQTLVSGMGELHLEIIRERLETEYGLQVRMGRPQVVYHETVMGQGEATHVFERNLEDEVLFGLATVRVLPRPRGQGSLVRSATPPASPEWPQPLQRAYPALCDAALDGVREAMGAGPSGNKLEDVEAVLIGVEPRLDVASDVGWRIAGSRALIKACEKATTALLEPIMQLEVVVPDEFVGDVLGDLNQRKAQILDVGMRGNKRTVLAQLPLRALFGYSTAVRSATQGRANFFMTFAKYDAWS